MNLLYITCLDESYNRDLLYMTCYINHHSSTNLKSMEEDYDQTHGQACDQSYDQALEQVKPAAVLLPQLLPEENMQ